MSLIRLACPRLGLGLIGVGLVVAACGGRDLAAPGAVVDGAGGTGVGGTGIGGTGVGGTGVGGTGGTGPACQVTFLTPSDGALLTHLDDADADRCAEGFQYRVRVSTDAPDGVVAALFADAQQVGSAPVRAGIADFDEVQLPAQGAVSLLAALDWSTGCETRIDLEVDCGVPSCDITHPQLDPSKPKLNGVPIAQGGDRQSATGAPYRTPFEVATSIADGQPVVLQINGQPSAFSALAQNGVASFPGVTLDPDGLHTVEAACFGEEGVVGHSAQGMYVVDSVAPSLVVQKVSGAATASLLQNGDHFGPADDADPDAPGLQLRICGATDAPDAVNLSSLLAGGQNNFCVGVGTSTPQCVPAVSGGAFDADGACVEIDCPGVGLFSLNVGLKDDAGNPTTRTVDSLTCASTTPSVQFLDPVSDVAPFADTSRRILAFDNAGATRKDKNGALPGAQYDVVVCTTATAGTAKLLGGLASAAPTAQIATGTVTAAVPADGCPSGMLGKVVFADVTLPQSAHTSKFELIEATRLVAEVTDTSSVSGTAEVDVWVDTVNPTLSLSWPAGLCGGFLSSSGTAMEDLTFATALAPVEVTVNGESCEPTCVPSSSVTFGSTTVDSVPFELDTNELAAVVTKPSSNQGRITSPCLVTVGPHSPPSIAWQNPVSTSRLTASATTGGVALPDADDLAPGWQGNLKVCTDIDLDAHPGATVDFSIAGGEALGTAPLVEEGAGSCAELALATVPEGAPVQLRATTSEVDGGTGIATLSVPVDVTPPDAIASISSEVLERRATSFRLSFTAPADGAGSVSSYQVRVSRSIIDTEGAFAAATVVPYAGSPAVAGAPDSVDVLGQIIENDHYFAVAAVDLVGNRGPIQHTSAPLRAEFKAVLLTAPSGSEENFGSPIDGSGDLNGDGYSDVVVGNLLASTVVRVYFGGPSGPTPGASTTITGSAFGFGASVALSDFNGDGLADLVVGSPGEGRVYIFSGRTSWPSALSSADAATVVRVESALPDWENSALGISVANLGDFNGDGRADLAVGASGYGGGRGLVAVLLGQSGGFGSEVVLPAAFGGAAIRFEGQAGQSGYFGWSLLGLGHFFDSSRTDLVVGAPYHGGGTGGAVFAFRGRAVTAATFFADEADGSLSGSANEYLGLEGLAPFGKIGPLGQPALGLSLPFVSGKGRAKVFSGTAAAGPFGSLQTELGTAETGGGGTGRVTGGGFSGTGTVVSVIGSAAPDLILPSTATGSTPGQQGPKVFIVSAETLQSIGGALTQVETVADVTYMLPTPWRSPARNVTVLRDVDGDGYGDIAVGDVDYYGVVDGKVLVLH